jgi:hypothetical protein
MGVSCEREDNVGRNFRENVRTVTEKDARFRLRTHLSDGLSNIVEPGERIVDAADREWPNADSIIVEDADSGALKLASRSIGITPMVMVSKYSKHPQPRLQAGKRRNRFFDPVLMR